MLYGNLKYDFFLLKSFAKNMSCGTEIIVETPTGSSGQLPSNIQQSSGPGSGPNAPGDVSHLSTNLLDPVAAAVHRRRSSAILSADATGFCRICRKVIMKNETSHRCSNCQELVCDDCSSYSSREESKVCLIINNHRKIFILFFQKYWMCSFCRRRGSHLVLVTTSGQTLSSMSSAATTTAAESFSTSSTSSKRQLSVHSTTTAGMASSMNNLTSTGMTTTTNGQQRQQQQFLTATPNALNAKVCKV